MSANTITASIESQDLFGRHLEISLKLKSFMNEFNAIHVNTEILTVLQGLILLAHNKHAKTCSLL